MYLTVRATCLSEQISGVEMYSIVIRNKITRVDSQAMSKFTVRYIVAGKCCRIPTKNCRIVHNAPVTPNPSLPALPSQEPGQPSQPSQPSHFLLTTCHPLIPKLVPNSNNFIHFADSNSSTRRSLAHHSPRSLPFDLACYRANFWCN